MSEIPRTADELKAWRCSECGTPMAVFESNCVETFVMGATESASRALVMGVSPDAVETITRPAAYEHTITCENDHKVSWVRGV